MLNNICSFCKALWISTKILNYSLWKSSLYITGYNTRFQIVKDMSYFLSRQNIFFSKVFQTLSSGCYLLTEEEMMYLTQYNDKVPYKDDDLIDMNEYMDTINHTLYPTNTLDTMIDNVSIGNNKHPNYSNHIVLHSTTPLKSGMIAFAYEGKRGDQEVIIKVMKRNIQFKIEEAMHTIEWMVWMSKYIPWLYRLDIETIYNENKYDILSQMNFLKEVSYAQEMKQKNKHVHYVKIPNVYREYTEYYPNIIVLERLHGYNIKQLISQEEKYEYAKLVAKFIMKCILYDGIYHADFHSGNVFFITNDTTTTLPKRQLGIIDFGIMGRLTKKQQENFYSFFKLASLHKDAYKASYTLCELLVEPQQVYRLLTKDEKDNLVLKLSKYTEEAFNERTSFDVSLIYALNTILSTYHLKLARDFCHLELSMAVGNSVCNELAGGGCEYMKCVNEAIRELFPASLFDEEEDDN
jgi:predicted unusual protein kinase regulating ubiquinone biosynthesis (AarF/ABC1/UbiB family)